MFFSVLIRFTEIHQIIFLSLRTSLALICPLITSIITVLIPQCLLIILFTPVGCSKASAIYMSKSILDIFGMKCAVLRGGCLTGARHRGAKLHGFLSYLIKTAVARNSYTIFGYKGKQVRDNLHATDIGHLIFHIYSQILSSTPPSFPVVANLGGGRGNSVSVLEVIDILKTSFDLRLSFDISPQARTGDHKWYITDNSPLFTQFAWKPTYSIHDIINDILVDS